MHSVLLGFSEVTINSNVTERLGPITINPLATDSYMTLGYLGHNLALWHSNCRGVVRTWAEVEEIDNVG
jgi:hypothetical protein